jgi:glycolate oxidase iron-sulfur subunit
MDETLYLKELSKCVRCGTCKTFCPTYLNTLNEAMGARGRVAMLGELGKKELVPTKTLAEKIFSCMLCGACKNLCPTGINIPELIYQGRNELKGAFKRGRAVRSVLKHSISRLGTLSPMLKLCQTLFYKPLNKAGLVRYLPDIASRPFNQQAQVYKNMKKIGRVAIFAGCSVNYFYPKFGNALSSILLAKGYEVVVFKGEECCGAPLRSMGLEKEAALLAQKNIEHFNKVRAEAIVSMCPTCTMVIKEQYPVLTGGTITNIMDINEFISQNNIASGLAMKPSAMTYHDPCHLSYGLGIRDKPRQILNSIEGINLVEMKHADECCGFAGFFNVHYTDMSETIGKQKIQNISDTSTETVVTSCPGCIMQMEIMKRNRSAKFNIKHIVEVIDEAMHE